jgi:hypothetical protein
MCGAIFLPQQRQSDALVQHGICGQQGRYQSGEADQEGLRRRLPFGDRDHSGDRRRSGCPRGISTAPRTRAPSIRPKPQVGATGAGQFATDAQARARCPSDTVVWVNTKSNVYHFAGRRDYGNTKQGAYMCEADAKAAGDRAAKNEKHP